MSRPPHALSICDRLIVSELFTDVPDGGLSPFTGIGVLPGIDRKTTFGQSFRHGSIPTGLLHPKMDSLCVGRVFSWSSARYVAQSSVNTFVILLVISAAGISSYRE